MNESTPNVVALKDAAQQRGVDDLALKRLAKRAHCYHRVAGIDHVDVEALRVYLEREVQDAMQRHRQERKGPDEYALVKARLTRYPKWSDAKEAKIAELKGQAEEAANAYEEARIMRKVERLEDEHTRMAENEQRDRQRINQLIKEAENQRKQRLNPGKDIGDAKPSEPQAVAQVGHATPVRNRRA